MFVEVLLGFCIWNVTHFCSDKVCALFRSKECTMCVVEYESLRSVVTGDIAAIATYCCLQNQNAECLENQNGITQIESISATQYCI